MKQEACKLPNGLPSYDTVRRTAGNNGVRSHWARENNLHWCLDVLFSADECTVLDRNAAENGAIIRKIVYNRIKMFSQLDTLSMGKHACIYDDEFRAQILFLC